MLPGRGCCLHALPGERGCICFSSVSSPAHLVVETQPSSQQRFLGWTAADACPQLESSRREYLIQQIGFLILHHWRRLHRHPGALPAAWERREGSPELLKVGCSHKGPRREEGLQLPGGRGRLLRGAALGACSVSGDGVLVAERGTESPGWWVLREVCWRPKTGGAGRGRVPRAGAGPWSRGFLCLEKTCDLEASHGQLPAGRLPASTPLPCSEARPFFVQPPTQAPSGGRLCFVLRLTPGGSA